MPTSVPVPDKTAGDVFTEAMWDDYIKDNVNKLLNRGHRTLTVAQFAALAADVEDGDEVYVEVDAANGLLWHFVYESAEVTYEWRFLGGPPMVVEITTNEATASAVFAALATAGPSTALPRAGDYDVKLEAGIGPVTAAHASFMSYDIGATGALDADAIYGGWSNVSTDGHYSLSRERRKAGLTAVTLTSKYRVSANSTEFRNRRMVVTPVRIRHDA